MLFLGGCVQATRTVFIQHYDLGTSATGASRGGPAATRGEKTLRLARIAVPPWLAGNEMYYRLEYRDDRRLAAYGRSDWIAPPATLLEPIIQRAIATGGGWRAVIGPGNPAAADASLHLRLDDFSQVFPRLRHSAGVIDATATLIGNHDGNVIAQRHFHVEAAAPTLDAQGGAKALAKAGRQLAARVQAWLQRTGGGT